MKLFKFRTDSEGSLVTPPLLGGVKSVWHTHASSPGAWPLLWHGPWGVWNGNEKCLSQGLEAPPHHLAFFSLLNKPRSQHVHIPTPLSLHTLTGNPNQDKQALCVRFYNLHAAR